MLPAKNLMFVIANKGIDMRVGCYFSPSHLDDLFLTKLTREHWNIVSKHTIDLHWENMYLLFDAYATQYPLLEIIKLTAALYVQGVTTTLTNYEKMYLMKYQSDYEEIIPTDFTTAFPETCDLYLELLTLPDSDKFYEFFYFKGVEAAFKAGYGTITMYTKN